MNGEQQHATCNKIVIITRVCNILVQEENDSSSTSQMQLSITPLPEDSIHHHQPITWTLPAQGRNETVVTKDHKNKHLFQTPKTRG